MSDYDIERLGELLSALPPAPAGWVAAARQLPAYRAELEDIAERAESDGSFRAALVADLEAALAASGYDRDRVLVAAVRARLFPRG